MTDETFVYVQEQREKSKTARSARSRMTHTGKRGGVKLPSDYMTKKEIETMSGKCETYQLNKPMTWAEFKKLPKDLRVMYIQAIRNKWNTKDDALAEMFGTSRACVFNMTSRLGMSGYKKTGKFDKEGFYAWVNGEKTETAALEEMTVPQDETEEKAEDLATSVRNLREQATHDAIAALEECLERTKRELEIANAKLEIVYLFLGKDNG